MVIEYRSPMDVSFTVKAKDMNDEMVAFVQQMAKDVYFKHTSTTSGKFSAGEIKAKMDEKYGPSWQVVVGRQFGCRVSHQPGHLILFYVGYEAVFMFKYNPK